MPEPARFGAWAGDHAHFYIDLYIDNKDAAISRKLYGGYLPESLSSGTRILRSGGELAPGSNDPCTPLNRSRLREANHALTGFVKRMGKNLALLSNCMR